ncbi:unnamed protein product [Bursaphelenchus okinawaensis]|uniref:Telomere length regulation protein conserved domain-containing protein n=1 Tax=Bursaphelenchus okinawaensis TaxID=465554 RepID=A0A811JWU7_9BILA|nr:unnamed protein product [Bursaphelenchus okinawaensis]CAG9086426.1 unnamed protein product [Bursaphelenchus okinawaensis]
MSEDLDNLTEAELKVKLAQIVEETSVDDITQLLAEKLVQPRIWDTVTKYLCLQRIYKPEPVQSKRISYKVAQVVRNFGQEKLRQAFRQLLQLVSDNFNGSFDEMYQKIGTIVDFACLVDPGSLDNDITMLEPFIHILHIDQSTSDTRSQRLALKFAAFLANFCFKNEENGLKMGYEEEEEDDLVSQLFNNLDINMKNDEKDSEESEDKGGVTIDEDELVLLVQKDGPRSLKDFLNFWTEKEKMEKTFMALKTFPKFAYCNRSAIKAQSSQLIKTLYIIGNVHNIRNFNDIVSKCLVQVLYSDLNAVPELLAKLDQERVMTKRIQVIKVVNDLMDMVLHQPDHIQPPKPQTRPKKELGKVVRKSKSLQKTHVTVPKAAVDCMTWIMVPFFNQCRRMELGSTTDPNFVAVLINFLKNSIDWRPVGLLKVVHDYFYLLKAIRTTSTDWSNKIQVIRLYVTLRQFAVENEILDEVKDELTDCANFIQILSAEAVKTADKNVKVYLDELEHNIRLLVGDYTTECSRLR